MKSKNKLKFRYPDFTIIRNTAILFIVIFIAALLIYHFLNIHTDTNFIFNALLIGCLILITIEFFFLNIWWINIVLDRNQKKVVITKNIFFFLVKKSEIHFEDIKLSLTHDYLYTGNGGYVWFLRIVNKKRDKEEYDSLIEAGEELSDSTEEIIFTNENYEIAHSLRKTPLFRKKQKILDFIKSI